MLGLYRDSKTAIAARDPEPEQTRNSPVVKYCMYHKGHYTQQCYEKVSLDSTVQCSVNNKMYTRFVHTVAASNEQKCFQHTSKDYVVKGNKEWQQ